MANRNTEIARAYRIAYYAAHRDEICRKAREKAKHDRLTNSDVIRAKERLAREKRRDTKNASLRKYWEENKDRLNRQRRERRKEYQEEIHALDKAAYFRKDKEKRKISARKYYAKNRKKESVRKHKAYEKDPSIWTARSNKRRANKRNAEVNDCTLAQWREIQAAYKYRCVYCGKKPKKLEQEHITPLSKGGNHTAANIVPSCASCNRRKGVGEAPVMIQPLLLTVAQSRVCKEADRGE